RPEPDLEGGPEPWVVGQPGQGGRRIDDPACRVQPADVVDAVDALEEVNEAAVIGGRGRQGHRAQDRLYPFGLEELPEPEPAVVALHGDLTCSVRPPGVHDWELKANSLSVGRHRARQSGG